MARKRLVICILESHRGALSYMKERKLVFSNRGQHPKFMQGPNDKCICRRLKRRAGRNILLQDVAVSRRSNGDELVFLSPPRWNRIRWNPQRVFKMYAFALDSCPSICGCSLRVDQLLSGLFYFLHRSSLQGEETLRPIIVLLSKCLR